MARWYITMRCLDIAVSVLHSLNWICSFFSPFFKLHIAASTIFLNISWSFQQQFFIPTLPPRFYHNINFLKLSQEEAGTVDQNSGAWYSSWWLKLDFASPCFACTMSPCFACHLLCLVHSDVACTMSKNSAVIHCEWIPVSCFTLSVWIPVLSKVLSLVPLSLIKWKSPFVLTCE